MSNKQPTTNNLQPQINPAIKKEFPRDPMMQKLHQIRKNLMGDQNLWQVLKSIEQKTRLGFQSH